MEKGRKQEDLFICFCFCNFQVPQEPLEPAWEAPSGFQPVDIFTDDAHETLSEVSYMCFFCLLEYVSNSWHFILKWT